MKLAVIGGGPIGLTIALYLAKQGHQVDLYEKGTWPRDKTCGQGIMPSGMENLRELGIHFNENEHYAFNGISYQDGEFNLTGLLPRKGHGVERKTLSAKLIELVKSFPQIRLFPETHVQNIRQLSDKVKLSANGECLVYDYLFAADGMNSQIRKLCGNRVVRKGLWRLGAREHFAQKPWSDKVEVYWSEGAEAYVTPVSETKVEVAFLWFEDLELDGQTLRENLWSRFPKLKEKIEFPNSQNDFRGYGPFSSKARDVQVGRIFFVGDAYCFLDGITGEGISLGIKGAKIISENFQRWNQFSSLISRLKFHFYYLHYTFMVNLALSLSQWRHWRRFIFKVLKRTPGSFRFLLYLNDL